ncbi:uncharacterized protein LDX57_006135 [Aspergillus melleus]|uniref:uncharacterized protein n=1 Tax=Aspergillus melleus TaxID=138277 RepID=UPI001E8D45F2|nr:uncharacterized protein LDX57_006135 [Aspergillus melleus]KAH8428437.1 hypothetical protein LDX57_006135 [Aspergillus melleus]
MWTWGLGDYRVDRVPRLQESITYLVRYMEEHGPFDGIIGSSAGASVAVVLGSLLEGKKLREGCQEIKMVTTHPPVKFILSYSGFKMSHVCYHAIYRPKIQTPVMHFIGNLDTYIPGPLTLQLARRCVNHRVVYFHGCHYIPRLGFTTMAAGGFICDCLGGKGEGSGRLSPSHSHSQGGDVEEGEQQQQQQQENDGDGEWEWVEDEKTGDWVAKL